MAYPLSRLLLLLLSGTLLLPAAAPALADESRAVLTALLADQRARTTGDMSHFCVDPTLTSPSNFAGPRQDPSVPRPVDDFQWYMPSRNGWPGPVEPGLVARLDALLANAPDSVPPPAGTAIDGSMLPPPFRLGGQADCTRTYSFSAPLILDDIAFVDRSYTCGMMCGRGDIVALQRREGRWIPVALSETWIS